MLHIPVLLEESIDFLIQDKDGFYIDCTFGRGGHSKLILKKLSSKGFLSSFDKDPDAFKFAQDFKEKNFKSFHDSFKNLDKYFKNESVNGIIYDLGTCSTHLDDPDRGFSFNKDGPLDMRFNNSVGITVGEWLEKAQKKEITEILYKYGDEKHGKLIADVIDKERKNNPINTTLELAEVIKKNYPEKNKKIHPATKSFQAFRIFINKEIEEFEKSLQVSKEILKRGGVIVTIAFHSLEDNLIKNSFKPLSKQYPKDIPLNNEEEKSFKCIAKKIRPSEDEVNSNPRARSAIMRVFQKI